ncbi:hypothetical protein PPL_08692 [Heterostelium album PN500]|uniref:Uncharacterized protein n=1 Tax=Heterostelium pallidum (strain ATCC 26659 / Pp 5 / PN500) TaxID=670386 RepID=D3BJG6_HETP5|nr:hypothetical protein PPL_08692 [Heterostelium album PN500]EFA78046.1 hypothetical protein PPL_08692 [Heterostelium album PN500]|eukprot:XP_020430173.1 hypothetical protein PPL_08692 [Heterostelium album PN500]
MYDLFQRISKLHYEIIRSGIRKNMNDIMFRDITLLRHLSSKYNVMQSIHSLSTSIEALELRLSQIKNYNRSNDTNNNVILSFNSIQSLSIDNRTNFVDIIKFNRLFHMLQPVNLYCLFLFDFSGLLVSYLFDHIDISIDNNNNNNNNNNSHPLMLLSSLHLFIENIDWHELDSVLRFIRMRGSQLECLSIGFITGGSFFNITNSIELNYLCNLKSLQLGGSGNSKDDKHCYSTFIDDPFKFFDLLYYRLKNLRRLYIVKLEVSETEQKEVFNLKFTRALSIYQLRKTQIQKLQIPFSSDELNTTLRMNDGLRVLKLPCHQNNHQFHCNLEKLCLLSCTKKSFSQFSRTKCNIRSLNLNGEHVDNRDILRFVSAHQCLRSLVNIVSFWYICAYEYFVEYALRFQIKVNSRIKMTVEEVQKTVPNDLNKLFLD